MERIKKTVVEVLMISAVCSLCAMAEAGDRPGAKQAETTHWYSSPTLGVMTGFIKEPLKPYTIQEWEKGLGNKMNADRWATDFKEAGATYLIFYD